MPILGKPYRRDELAAKLRSAFPQRTRGIARREKPKYLRKIVGADAPRELRYGSRAPAPSPCWTWRPQGMLRPRGSLRRFCLKSSELRVNAV